MCPYRLTVIPQINVNLQFCFGCRPFDTPGRRKLLFTADSGPTDLLFAYHDSDPSLVHHTARVGTTVDLQQEPPAPGDKDLVTSEEDEVESGSSPSCEPSDIADFTCMTKASDLEVHWENGANEAMFAVRAPVAGTKPKLICCASMNICCGTF